MTNPYFIALGIPIVLMICGAFARKLVRGSQWISSDFYLGIELALSAMASALVYLFDLAKPEASRLPAFQAKISATGGYLSLCFFLLLWVMSVHQDWEKRTQNALGQRVWLGGVANVVGALLLATFVLLVKGV
jgi:hypothetical protein